MNLTLSDVNNALRKASYGQLALKTDNPKLKTRNLEKGVDTMWVIAADDEIQNLTSPVNPYDQIARIKALMELTANAYNIPIDEFNSVQSALAKMVGRWDIRLNSLRHEADLLRQASDLYRIIAPVWNYHQGRDKQLDTSLVLSVCPGRVPYPKDDLHAAQADERRYAAGTTLSMGNRRTRQTRPGEGLNQGGG
jgi:HAMP domain-containing protein